MKRMNVVHASGSKDSDDVVFNDTYSNSDEDLYSCSQKPASSMIACPLLYIQNLIK